MYSTFNDSIHSRWFNWTPYIVSSNKDSYKAASLNTMYGYYQVMFKFYGL